MATTDKLNRLKQTKADLKAALIEKGQAPGDVFADYPAKVRAIETGGGGTDVSGVTAAASDVRKGKVFVDSTGAEKEGTQPTRGSADVTLANSKVTVPAGIYDQQVQVDVPVTEQATPVIEVSNGGLITATAGDKSATKQLSTQSGKTITPGPTEQIAVAAGKYVTGDIIVEAVQGGGGSGDGSPYVVNVPVNVSAEVSVSSKKYPSWTSACNDTTSTSLTGTIEAKAGAWVLATVTTRSAATYPDGWTLLHESGYVTTSDGTNQKMAFLCKYVDTAETVSFTVNQAASGRIYINLIAVTGCQGFRYHGDSENLFNTAAGSFTVTKPDYDYVFWGCSAISWSNNAGQWSCSQISASVIGLGSSAASRQGNFFDDGAPGTRTFTPQSTSTMAIIDCVEVLM